MSEAKGPKVEVPDELADELEEAERIEISDAEVEIDVDAAAAPEEAPAAEGPGAEGERPERDPEAELEALKERHLRLAADFENYKRRTMRERQELHNYATENLIKELLPAVDNLERALGHARRTEEGDETTKALLEGVELTHRSVLQVLEKFGVAPVLAEGQEFNPQVHEAVRQVPTDEHPPGHIVEVLQKGYLLKDRLLRPALVAVAARSGGGDD